MLGSLGMNSNEINITSKISRFDKEFAFLSNFWRIDIQGPSFLVYPTVEHAYQAAKSDNPLVHKAIQLLPTPGNAKRAGREVIIRPDWNTIKVEIMRQLIVKKFDQKNAPILCELLLATQDRYLEEGNYWGDTFWGVFQGRGRNTLGSLLMSRRVELKSFTKGT